jgi:autotransporter-associated beta strand protein
MSGGTAVLTNRLFIGDGSGSAGTLTLSGAAAMSVGGIQLGVSSGTGTLNLNGGTLTVNGNITNGTGSGTFNFNGGTLKAGVSSAMFMTNVTAATVNAGGAIIDSGANAVTIPQPLLDGGGALVKLGSGTLTLSGVSTYSGGTTISNGTLVVNGSVAGPVTVKSGATLGGNGSVGGVVTVEANGVIGAGSSIGTLTLGGSPVLGGAVVAELNRNGGAFTNDLIDAGSNPLIYGGTLVLTNTGAPLQVNDTFKLFNTSGGYSGSFTLTSQTPGQTPIWDTSNLTVNGTIRVASLSVPLPTTPTNIVFSTTGNQLSLSWPSNYTGWLLESNSVSLLNTGAWATVTGSSTTNQVTMTIDSSKRSVFFRMRLP